MSTIIQLKEVCKIIKSNTIIDKVSLDIEQGEICGFVGHNGSGKSMIFRLITGLVIPTSGQVIVNGKTLHEDTSFPQNTSVILEKPGFLEHYSALDNLYFLAGIQKKVSKELVRTAIKRVGLDPDDRRAVKTYSLGMKQKLALAQAIMEQPDIILLDEPMNGLDEDSVSNIYKIISEENQRGATILMTSHHRADIETLCKKVYKVNSGKVSLFNE